MSETAKSNIKLDPSWMKHLSSEFEKEYMVQLKSFLKSQATQKKVVYPADSEYFAAFNLTPLQNVKVVIVGQDPYHGPGQAHGLSFSVQRGVRIPPSLKNIFKELKLDLNIEAPKNGDLTLWAEQGVLLLNSVLTVEDGLAASHQKKGWEQFTDRVIHLLNEERENIVYILWGASAQKKASFVDRKKNLVLESVHPSPLSSHRGFFGSKPFSKANKYLVAQGLEPIDWSLKD